jgi:hypothetical protein
MEAKETAAHNVVLIDGVGQHNAGNSIGTDGRITTVLLGAFADYVCGDAASAYVTYSPFNAPDVPFPGSDWSWGYDGGNPVERADRHIVWVKGAGAPPYCLIADDIRKDGAPHQYDWRLHTDSTNVVDHATNPVVISGAQSELQLFFAQPQAQQGLQFHSGPFSHSGEDPASTWFRARRFAVEPAFFVALVPRTAALPQPMYESSAGGSTTASQMTLDWGSVQDIAVFNPQRSLFSSSITTNGKIAVVRGTASETDGFLLVEGTLMNLHGGLLLLLGDTANAQMTGDALILSRSDVWFIAYGPDVTQVWGPEGAIPFERDGETVRSLVVNTAVDEALAPAPGPLLVGNQPNPFNAGTQLRFELPVAARVRIQVFDARGRLVRTLVDAYQDAGAAVLHWDGRDDHGRKTTSGGYIVQLEAGGQATSRKIVIVR